MQKQFFVGSGLEPLCHANGTESVMMAFKIINAKCIFFFNNIIFVCTCDGGGRCSFNKKQITDVQVDKSSHVYASSNCT